MQLDFQNNGNGAVKMSCRPSVCTDCTSTVTKGTRGQTFMNCRLYILLQQFQGPIHDDIDIVIAVVVLFVLLIWTLAACGHVTGVFPDI